MNPKHSFLTPLFSGQKLIVVIFGLLCLSSLDEQINDCRHEANEIDRKENNDSGNEMGAYEAEIIKSDEPYECVACG
jgi:hypothetical protein